MADCIAEFESRRESARFVDGRNLQSWITSVLVTSLEICVCMPYAYFAMLAKAQRAACHTTAHNRHMRDTQSIILLLVLMVSNSHLSMYVAILRHQRTSLIAMSQNPRSSSTHRCQMRARSAYLLWDRDSNAMRPSSVPENKWSGMSDGEAPGDPYGAQSGTPFDIPNPHNHPSI